MKRSSRRLAPAAAVVVCLWALTGCSLTNEQTTQLQYVPSDGALVGPDDLGGLGVYNLILVATSAEEPGNLVGRVVNPTGEDQTVTITGTGAAEFDVEVDVAAGETVDLGPDGEQVLVEPAGEVPGRLVPVQVSAGESTVDLTVPVLDDTLEEYADLVPTAASTATS